MRFFTKKIISLTTLVVTLVANSLSSFSQVKEKTHSELLSELSTKKADTPRVHLLLKLTERYLHKTGNKKADLDSALQFAAEAVRLSKVLRYEKGKNEAILLTGDVFIKTDQINKALSLLNALQDSTRFRLLIMLSNHYLEKQGSSKSATDSSLVF